MKDKIILVLLMSMLSFGCSTKKGYVEVSPKFLKQELNTTQGPDGWLCSWYYSYESNKKYHLFTYRCIPDETPKGSAILFFKKYKVKREQLQVLCANGIYQEGQSVPVDSMKIIWNE
jgi:hypothetical protein